MTNSIQLSDSITLPQLKLKISVQPDATTEKAIEAIDIVCGALARQESSVVSLRQMLGKLLVETKARKLFKPTYRTFEEFKQEVCRRNQISRATVQDAMAIAEELPMLAAEQAAVIPLTNITLAARAARGMEPPAVRLLLKSAEKMSVLQFREKVESEGLVEKRGAVGRPAGKSTTTLLRIRVTKAVAARWEAFVGGKDAGRMLASLLSAARESMAA